MHSIYKIRKKLIRNLKEINLQTNTKICSFDIKNMHTNIPQNDLIDIINNVLTNNSTPDDQKREIITLVKSILNQITYNTTTNFIHKMKD
jgi:hypothetical protein